MQSAVTRLLLLTIAFLLCAAVGAPARAAAPWVEPLKTELARIDAGGRADLGVYVRDLETGEAAGHRADETWYLASTVKLPVALAVLRAVARGEVGLQTTLRLRADDRVDGGGRTNAHPVGRALSVRYLLEQMMVHSDNTASDMLIGLVGLREVNALVQSLVPIGFQPITTMADVRRHIYAHLDPAAHRLSGQDFLLLQQQRGDAGRRAMLARLLQRPPEELRLPSVADAYAAYYASGLNSARLEAYGELLAQVARGEVLSPADTRYLLELMARARTGLNRIQAGLPPGVRFAHKTGTQSARTCDSGVILVPRPGGDRRIVVAACTRGEPSLAHAEDVLRRVGLAICRSGLLGSGLPGGGGPHEISCPVDARMALDPRAAR